MYIYREEVAQDRALISRRKKEDGWRLGEGVIGERWIGIFNMVLV